VVLVDVLHHAGKGFEGLLDLGAVPVGGAVPQALVALGAEGAQEDRFHEVGGGPDAVVAHGQGGDARALEGVGDLEELVKGGGWFQAVVGKGCLVVPQDVGAVDVDRHAPDLAIVGQDVDDAGRVDVEPVVLLEDKGHGLHLVGDDPGVDELVAGVDLKGVGRVVGLHAGGEDGLGVGAGAAGHGGVDDLDVGILLGEHLVHGVQAVGLAAGRPPRKDLQVARQATRRSGRGPLSATDPCVEAGLGHGSLGSGHVEVADKEGHGVVDGGDPALGSGSAVGQAGGDFVGGKVIHGRLEVGVVEGAVAVGAGRDGALEGVEGILAFLGAGEGQPGHGVVAVGSALGQPEGVGEHHEDAVGARGGHPAELLVGREADGLEVALGPVAHDGHGGIAVGHELGGLVPGEGGVVLVDVLHHAGKGFEGLLDLGAVPVGGAVPQALVALGAEGAQEDRFHEVGGGPDAVVAHGQGGDARALEGVGDLEELVKGGGWFQAVVGKGCLVVPQDVGAVDVDRHAPDLAIVGQDVDDAGRVDVEPVVLLEDKGHGLHLVGDDPGVDELVAGVDLKGVGRVVGLHAGGEDGLGVGAGAAGHGGVDDLDVGILLGEHLVHGVQAVGLAAGRPPRKDLQVAGSCCRLGGRGLGRRLGRFRCLGRFLCLGCFRCLGGLRLGRRPTGGEQKRGQDQ